MSEQVTFTIAKPDAVQRGIVGRIMSHFEDRGLLLAAARSLIPTEELVRNTYLDKSTEPFFGELLAYMTSGPVLAMAWRGEDAVAKARQQIGEKEPLKSAPGSIRGSLPALDRVRTLVHGSRSVEEANAELSLWLPDWFPGPVTPAADRPASDAPKILRDWYGEEAEELARW